MLPIALKIAVCLAIAGAGASASLVDVFEAGTFGYFCFRIPALVRAPNGTLLAFAEGRNTPPNCHDTGSVDLVMKSSSDGGATWGALRLIKHATVSWNHSINVTVGNPAPVVANGVVYLPYALDTHYLGLLQSDDGGTTWVNVHNITGTASYPFNYTTLTSGPGASLALPSGRILVPAHGHYGNTGEQASLVFRSDDAGANWSHVAALPPSALSPNEACLAALPWAGAGAVLITARTEARPGSKVAARSDDGGETWSAAWQILKESPVQGSLLALPAFPGGPVVIQSDVLGTATVPRANLTLHSSSDDGRTFRPIYSVWPNASAYSSMIAGRGPSSVNILFERGAKLTANYWEAISFLALDL